MNSERKRGEREIATSIPCACQRVSMPRPAISRRMALHSLAASGMVVSLSGCAWVDSKQRQLIFRPTPGQPADFAGLGEGDEAFVIELPQAGVAIPHRLQLWWVPNQDLRAPTLLYLHGTFRN